MIDRAAVELVGIAQLQGVVGGYGPLKALHLPKPQLVSDHQVDRWVSPNGGPGLGQKSGAQEVVRIKRQDPDRAGMPGSGFRV